MPNFFLIRIVRLAEMTAIKAMLTAMICVLNSGMVGEGEVEPKIFVAMMLYEYVDVTGCGCAWVTVVDEESNSIPDALS